MAKKQHEERKAHFKIFEDTERKKICEVITVGVLCDCLSETVMPCDRVNKGGGESDDISEAS